MLHAGNSANEATIYCLLCPHFLPRFPAHDELGTEFIHLHGVVACLLLTMVHQSSFISVRVLGTREGMSQT